MPSKVDGAITVMAADAILASDALVAGKPLTCTAVPRPCASPRGALALLKLARAKAALAGREFVTPDDVKAVAVPALAHRLALQPELWVRRVEPDQVVRQILDTVPTPAPADLSQRGS